jgi:hypothetical protein
MRRSSLITSLAVFLLVPCLHAHSIHQSTAEAEYNPTTKKLEVSLTVFIDDLELALMRQSERLMSIDKTPAAEFDAQIQAYLAKTFVVTDAAGKVAKIEWVGRELAQAGDPAVMLHFEIPIVGELATSTLRHAVLCDLFKDQLNLLLVSAGTRKEQLKFTANDPMKPLVMPPPPRRS